MRVPALPIDIWLLVCQELTARQDFTSLFNFALASRTMASLALPNLYSIHELASTSTDASIIGKKRLATLWRCIILSSIGKTLFPYCLWIRNLKLGDLQELLSDIAPNPSLRKDFFAGSMSSFEVLQRTSGLNVTTRQNRPWLDFQEISYKVGDTITLFVKEAADRDNKAVGLSHLEGQYIPMDILPVWTSRLATLTTLHIQDGSVIGEHVAQSIRDNCPRFKELTCFYCDGPSVDEDLASFFKTLRPNSLEVFSVSSKNRLGGEAFSAISLHAASLRKLRLSGLQFTAFSQLGALRPCISLETLDLEGERSIVLDWKAAYPESFADTISWLSSCASLTDLKLWHVPSATTLLKEVLKAPDIHLVTLDLNLIDEDAEFYESLGSQTSLESFLLRSIDFLPEYPSVQHTQLVQSLCKLRMLKVLDILQTILAIEDVNALAVCLEQLEEFGFDGELFDDSIFDTFLVMHKLRSISISATTLFTFNGIIHFIDRIRESRLSTGEFNLSIMNQTLQAKLLQEEVEYLANYAQTLIGGRLEIEHPEEEHESDFSD